jgi:hypothetical protein
MATFLAGENENQMVVDLDELPEGVKEGGWFEEVMKGNFCRLQK